MSLIESHPEHAEQDADLVRWQYENGSDNWREMLDVLVMHDGGHLTYSELRDETGFDPRALLSTWKRTVAPLGAENSRPYHIAKLGRGTFVAWMDDTQRAAIMVGMVRALEDGVLEEHAA